MVSKNCVLFFVFCFAVFLQAKAQSLAGITGKRDTSYTNNAALQNVRKSNPDASIALVPSSKGVKEKQNLVYCSLGERQLLTDVFYPSAKSKSKRAAIIIIHGGGWRSGNRQQHMAMARKLAQLGYVCFTPEYRLSTEALYPAAVYDLKAAIRWVHAYAKKYNIDTTKIAIAGFSAGGQLATLLGTTINNPSFEGTSCHTTYSSNVQAIINLDGTLSFVHSESGEGDDSKKTSAATYWFGYTKKEARQLWEEASPLTHVSASTPPVLFINSGVARMHAGRDDFRKVLQANNIYSEIKTFDNAPHHFPLMEPWFTPMVTYMDDFLQRIFSLKANKQP